MPDLVILDIHMPDMSGLDVCRKLREQEATRSTPILLITAHTATVAPESAKEAGATGFIKKPFSPRDLIEQVDSLLSSDGGCDDGGNLGQPARD